MCGIALNPQNVEPGEPRRYDTDVFLVFPRDRRENRRENNYILSEWDITIPEQEERSSTVSGPSSGNGESPIQPSEQTDKQQSTTANNQRNSPPSDDTSNTPSPKAGKKSKNSTSRKQRHHEVAESTPRNEESSARNISSRKQVSFDLPNSTIGKKVRFAMDFITPSRASSGSSSSSSSTISGSKDSFVDASHPNVPIDANSNGHHAPESSTFKLPPNMVAESAARHRRDKRPDPTRKVREWKVETPAPKSAAPNVEATSRQRRPRTPFEYATEEEDEELDSELGSSVDRGSAVPSSREQLRSFHTGRNTKWNSGKLDHSPAVTDSDLSSELGSNVDKSRPKPSWYRAPSPYQLPSVSEETEDRYDPLLGVTWRSV